MFEANFFKTLPDWLSFSILTFIAFFPMVDALGMVPLFNSMTQNMPASVVQYVARKSNLMAFLLTVLFGFVGESLFDIFHITIDSLKIVGGVIFFLMGYDMLQAKVSTIQLTVHPAGQPKQVRESADELALTPLAIPMLCGPGAITTSILFMDKTEGRWDLKAGFMVGVIGTFLFSWLCFASARPLFKCIGANGNKVILRLMGLLLMIVAVESFFSGLTPIVRNILQVPH